MKKYTKWSLIKTVHEDMVDEAIRLIVHPTNRAKAHAVRAHAADIFATCRWFRRRADGSTPVEIVVAQTYRGGLV